MRVINSLKKHFAQAGVELSLHRIDLVSRLVCALLQVRSVNLMKVATAMVGPAVCVKDFETTRVLHLVKDLIR